MKSRASIKGHPIHPILVTFPIAFFTGTLVFDVLSILKDNASYRQTADYLELAGLIAAIIAAVPGVIDYFFTVPPASSAKKRATQHGLANVLLLLIFAAAYLLRVKASFSVVIGLESAGFILMGISGWLGGTLVYRNQIGVDPRYAGAGKWNEAYLKDQDKLIEAAVSGELQNDQMKLLHIDGKRIVLAKTAEGYVAFDDRCTHKGGSLAGGMMVCGTVQCPWHGSQFASQTGDVKAGPATKNIHTYETLVKDGKIYLSLSTV
ncbi:DUF2231 domain-containing protein [Mucilaginibacter boryungensis]|uniref:Rieske 2Fe-2S domain-containing protein n=1 Tax=Mucilaginibacter boryungensis TaxID=768480 RepID=A0ABR9XFB5_9SPHI|nr:DUF2231 domain-containing protein [Mucilaginibacter boryungensis]MBE9665770.1 Rieske 2Fe-2S domain-containing protein [Mucilaginibacter boryungensis]